MSGANAIPAWLEGVLAGVPRRPVAFPDEAEWLVRAEPGELRTAQPMDPDGGSGRLMLVLEAYTEDDPWVNACLIAPAAEVAGDRDVLLDPVETGLPFRALVETDTVGPLLMVQLGPSLGRVDADTLEDLRAAVYGEWRPSLAAKRGIPIMNRNEARWRVKEEELAAMHALSIHCLAHHLARESEVQPADAILDPALLEPTEVTPAIWLLKVISVAEKERLAIDTPVEQLREGQQLREWVASLGPDEWRALEPIWQGGLRSGGPKPADDAGAVEWASRWPAPGADILARHVAAQARRGRRAFRVLTSASHWGDKADDVSRGVVGSLHIAEVGTVQVKPELIEEAA
jgi:hypothetical protein